MSVSYIPDKVKVRLWVLSAGRCAYEGCNAPLWKDEVTMARLNAAYIAHIVADVPDGPRGDPALSPQLKSDLTNLMLLCDKHHRLIDKEDVAGHPVERLKAMKALHESRIERLTAISPSKSSHVLLYGANIGKFSAPLTYEHCSEAMHPSRYPASDQPITVSLTNSSFEDNQERYWEIEATQLKSMLTQHLRPRLSSGEIKHLSVFALAPQPLLILLGTELSELSNCEVYQRRKEPPSWKWEDQPLEVVYTVTEPAAHLTGPPALVFSLSATISDDRIHRVLSDSAAIWRVTVDQPHNDFIRSQVQVGEFRKVMRPLLNRIKAKHGESATVHVFPAMPVSLAVEFGRVVNLKADLPMRIYDENKGQGGFVAALNIGGRIS